MSKLAIGMVARNKILLQLFKNKPRISFEHEARDDSFMQTSILKWYQGSGSAAPLLLKNLGLCMFLPSEKCVALP